jgi:hypothetical protein
MVQTRLHKHSLSKAEQAVSNVASRASVRDPINEFQDVYGSRAGSAAFRQQLGSDFSSSPQIQPPIQAKPSFRGLSHELAAESQSVQLREDENKTGLPDDLKAGVEALSGFSMDDVRVHYNSPKPAQLQALAYTQGTEIHVGPGQEKHLAHEAWHVVQQMQGRVKPTMQRSGVQINDDEELEREAEQYGKVSQQMTPDQIHRNSPLNKQLVVVQAMFARPANIPERHHLPNPDTVDSVASWYYGLVEERVFDLFTTAAGFIGHAEQVQNELQRVINHVNGGTYDEFGDEFWANFREGINQIKIYLIRLGRGFRGDLNKFVFTFPWNSSLSIRREKGILYVNNQQDIN